MALRTAVGASVRILIGELRFGHRLATSGVVSKVDAVIR